MVTTTTTRPPLTMTPRTERKQVKKRETKRGIAFLSFLLYFGPHSSDPRPRLPPPLANANNQTTLITLTNNRRDLLSLPEGARPPRLGRQRPRRAASPSAGPGHAPALGSGRRPPSLSPSVKPSSVYEPRRTRPRAAPALPRRGQRRALWADPEGESFIDGRGCGADGVCRSDFCCGLCVCCFGSGVGGQVHSR